MEGRMDASFGTTPLAMSRAIRLMETGLIDVARTISHRFPLTEIQQAVEMMGSPDRNKIIIQP
jgi:threonine dehydrogenase-like Zn-dependent dehydrogenase